MDSMLYMGISGSILIAVIVCFRHFFALKVPRRFLVFLWTAAILRLLLPVSIPVRYLPAGFWNRASAETGNGNKDKEMTRLRKSGVKADAENQTAGGEISGAGSLNAKADAENPAKSGKMKQAGKSGAKADAENQTGQEGIRAGEPGMKADADAAGRKQNIAAVMDVWLEALKADWLKALEACWLKALEACWLEKIRSAAWLRKILPVLWLSVAALLGIRISARHLHSLKCYRMSLPAGGNAAEKWLQEHRSFRKISVRSSDLISGPLTYGILRPVILLPSEIHLDEEEFLCIMEHEWVHIRRNDVFVKYLMCLAVCVYWFHPLVWMMARLLEQDMEIACDEEALDKYPDCFKKTYALSLIRLAQGRRDSLWPVRACFARHSEIEERIRMIMKRKKYSWKAAALAAGMICCTLTAFTVSAGEFEKEAAGKAQTAEEETETVYREFGVEQRPEPAETAEGETETIYCEFGGEQNAEPSSGVYTEEGETETVNRESGVEQRPEPAETAAKDTETTYREFGGEGKTEPAGKSEGEAETVYREVSGEQNAEPAETAAREAETVNQNVSGEQNAELAGKSEGEAESVNQKVSGERKTEPAETAARETETEPAEQSGKPARVKQGEQIAEMACKYLGNPFKHGGTDLFSGTDSAGFIKAVYELAGIALPSDIQKLAEAGTQIRLEELEAGDIVFYGQPQPDGEDAFHAGIYNGKGQVIHASNMRQGVKLSDYDYRPDVKAVRVLP